jgi:hypothetical protein
MEVTIIRKVELSMDEQKKYEVIKSLADHPAPNKQRAALTLGCTVRHINRMLKGYKEHGKAYFIHGNRDVNQPIPSPMKLVILLSIYTATNTMMPILNISLSY